MTAGRRILPMGVDAVLVEEPDLDAVLALHAALADDRPAGIVELVPAARTVLVRFDPARIGAVAVREWVAGATTSAAGTSGAAAEVGLGIVYDGADLDETARLLGLGPAELAERHARTPWQVAFTGFAPGFGYLVGEDWPHDVPRLAVPRTRVPAGAVGLAAGFTGAYPRETPGGWRLIGRTDAPLFDPAAARPALLVPGMRVRFLPERARATAAGGAELAPPATVTVPAVARIERAGSVTVQDLGRPGLTHLGVSRSGALDRGALRLANRLVGNPEDAAGIEIGPGGFVATALRDVWIATTGGWAPTRLDGVAVDQYRALHWRAGTVLEIGFPTHGARIVLALAGGVAAPHAFGSASTDTLAGLGPAPLVAGDLLHAGHPLGSPPPLDAGPWGWPPEVRVLRMRWGPRADWFTASARRRFVEAEWTVSTDADRVGARLEGPVLPRARTGELPSEAMVPGAVQVPPSGRPVILLADGPATGGYPVIAVVDDAALDAVAQAPPGARIRFRTA